MHTHAATTTRSSRYVAMDLVDYFIDAMEVSREDDRERIQCTILCAGQHLADCGEPGAWDLFEPASFLDKMSDHHDERVLICLDLAGLFGLMGMDGLLEPQVAVEILTRIRVAGPDEPDLRDLCNKGVAILLEE